MQESTLETFSSADSKDAHEAYSPQGPVRNVMTDGGIVSTGGPAGPRRMRPGQNRGSMHNELLKATMPGLASLLSQYMDHPVVDMTGLKGSYHLEFDIAVEDMQALGSPRPPTDSARDAAATAADPSGGIGIVESVEKLGLRLERRNAPIDMLVVDRLEKTPTEN